MRYRSVEYPIFLEVSQYTQDPYWRYVMEELAYGNGPYGVSIDCDAIRCRLTGKAFTFYYSNLDSITLYEQLQEILKTKLKLMSKVDLLNEKETWVETLRLPMNIGWVDIRKKSIKDRLIEQFVMDMKEQYGWTLTHARRMNAIVMTGFQFKLLTAKDIHYDSIHHRITSIDGIQIESGRIRLLKQMEHVGPPRPLDPPTPLSPSQLWSKYTEH
jgi:hypothetical protein